MIIIPTNTTRIDTWLKDCLASLDTKHEVMVLFQGGKPTKGLKIGFSYVHCTAEGYIPGAIVWAMRNKPAKEIFILHDSCIVKDNRLFDVLFNGYYEDSVALSKEPTMMGMFLGKYRMEILEQLKPPYVENKIHEVELEESWNREYCAIEQPILLGDPLVRTNVFEERHGRENQVLENKWIKKYKGTWDRTKL